LFSRSKNIQDTMNCQRLCQICNSVSHGQSYCSPCFQAFIKKRSTHGPDKVKGGGALIDETSRHLGQTAEDIFFDHFRSNHKKIRTATTMENRKRHYDFVVFEESLGRHIRVEVKSMKARKRGQQPDPNIIYLEVHNIDGFPGWVYGEADYVAFQTPTGFMMVNRIRLVEKVNHYFTRLPYVTESGIDYTLYGRFNRKDLVMILPFSEISQIEDKIIL